jgi:hypothetical protein
MGSETIVHDAKPSVKTAGVPKHGIPGTVCFIGEGFSYRIHCRCGWESTEQPVLAIPAQEFDAHMMDVEREAARG